MLQFIINYWIEIFFTIITSMVVAIYKYVKYKFKEQDIIKEGVQAILHDRLYQCGRYYIDRGHITLEELHNVEYLYNAYHNLGGNSTGTEIFERIKNLCIK